MSSLFGWNLGSRDKQPPPTSLQGWEGEQRKMRVGAERGREPSSWSPEPAGSLPSSASPLTSYEAQTKKLSALPRATLQLPATTPSRTVRTYPNKVNTSGLDKFPDQHVNRASHILV